MNNALYTNWRGQPVTHSSYSSRQTFKKCPREFELTRVQGWSDKERRAAPLFGKCVEAGVQWFEDNDRFAGSGVEKFAYLWGEVKNLPEFAELKFTDSEGDWQSLLRAGKEMMRIYEARVSYLPISTHPKALWQQELRKQIFPGSELDALENKAILDLLSFPRWNHPMLPPITEDEILPANAVDKVRPLIIDIKTSGGDLETDLIGLDPQLTEYAWQARIPDISFLWFVKRSHEIKTGSRVTLMDNCPCVCAACGTLESDDQREYDKDCSCGGAFQKPLWRAGYELIVLDYSYRRVEIEPATEKKKAKYEEVKDGFIYIAELPTFMEYKNTLHGLRGKIRDEAERTFREGNALIARVRESSVSKQRVQFAAARLTKQDMDEIGRDVAQTTVEMVRANREGYYPKLAGIRFPNEKCNYCAMRWICLNKPTERDQNLSRKGEEWLDGETEEE